MQQSKRQKANSAIEKLSFGSRINYARDDAVGQAVSMRLAASPGFGNRLRMQQMRNQC